MTKPSESAILGIGQTRFTKASGKTVLALCAEASRAAIRDAGLEPAEIDGMASFTFDTNDELLLQQTLGLPALRWTSRSPFGGGGAYVPFQYAIAAIESGLANNVLIFRAFNERSESRFGQPGAFEYLFDPDQRDFHRSFGLLTPALAYALWSRPYMARYGITSEDLGRYVVQARAYAAKNPNAWFYQRPITLEDHQNSRWIAEPVLRMFDCCQESDGGVAFVVSSVDRARRKGRPVIHILAADQMWGSGAAALYHFYAHDLTVAEDTQRLATNLWARSGLSPGEIDVMTIYEAFSPVIFVALESYGFCKPGEAKDLVKSGGIALDGTIPVNTNGGLLGEAYIHGLNNALEAVRQLRGVSPNQVPDARTAVVAALQCGMVLARE
jgi:acetyl-CoA acetyltransferase